MSIIRFIFSGDTKQLDEAGQRADKTLKDLKKEFREGISTSAKWSAAMAAAGAAIATHLVNKSLDAIDAQAKLARTLGTTIKGLEVTTRAAKLSGVELSGVEQATKDLTRRLSQAASGAGPAADALTRLKLSAEQLSQLPLDQRIATINQSIRDFIPAAEQAAVAGQLFGEEGSLAMQRIDPATLRAAAEDVKRFGTALSDVDAAQVEAANDAMAQVGQVVEGLINKFTVELAPVLTATAKMFIDTAASGDKLSEGPVEAFNMLVKGAGFVMDVIEGIRRIFLVAGQGLAVGILEWQRDFLALAGTIVDGPIFMINKLIEQFNKLPGVVDIDIVSRPEALDALVEKAWEAQRAVEAGYADINATLAAPLPSGQFKQFVEEAKAAGLEAAEAIVAAKEGVTGEGGGGGGISDDEKDKIAQRLELLRTSYQTELQDLQAKFGEEQEILADAYEAKLISEEEYKARLLEIEQGYQDATTELETKGADARRKVAQAEANARKQTVNKMFGDLSTLMNSESRKMFEVGKAAAISQTVLSTIEGAQKSYSSLAGIPIVGPALGAAAALAAVAGGVARVNAIRSQSFGGGGAPAVSNTQAVNAASTPVGGGESAPVGPTYTFVGIDPTKNYNGRDIAAALEDYAANGGRLKLG